MGRTIQGCGILWLEAVDHHSVGHCILGDSVLRSDRDRGILVAIGLPIVRVLNCERTVLHGFHAAARLNAAHVAASAGTTGRSSLSLLDLLRRKSSHAAHPGFDLPELRAVLLVVPPRQGADLLRHRLRAIAWIGVVAQELRSAWAALLFQLAEEIRHGLRVIARIMHDVCTYEIGLALRLSGILHKN